MGLLLSALFLTAQMEANAQSPANALYNLTDYDGPGVVEVATGR